jgi:hypothetical protein
MSRCAAICLFRSPETTRRSTSASRRVSDSWRSRSATHLERVSHGIEQRARLERLSQELDSACLDRADRGGDVAEACDEHDLDVLLELGQTRLQIRPAQIRELDVEHEAARRLTARQREKLHRGRERLRVPALLAQEGNQRFAHRDVIVDDVNARVGVRARERAVDRAQQLRVAKWLVQAGNRAALQ